jgi:hypothetical protein
MGLSWSQNVHISSIAEAIGVYRLFPNLTALFICNWSFWLARAIFVGTGTLYSAPQVFVIGVSTLIWLCVFTGLFLTIWIPLAVMGLISLPYICATISSLVKPNMFLLGPVTGDTALFFPFTLVHISYAQCLFSASNTLACSIQHVL